MHTLYENKIYVRKLCIYKMLWSKILRNKKSNKKEKKKSCSDYHLCRLLLAVGSRGEGKWKLIKVCITSYVVCACVCAPVRKIERPHARQRSRVRLDFRDSRRPRLAVGWLSDRPVDNIARNAFLPRDRYRGASRVVNLAVVSFP